MKRFILVLIMILSISGLFAQDILYQKQHKNLDSIDVVTLIKSEDDWYFISIVIAEDKDAVEKYMIYDTNLESIQDLLFNFEKEKNYKARIEAMEKAETLVFIKEETGIKDSIILRTKHYWYMK